MGDDAPLGRDLLEHRGVVALPQREAERVRVLVAPLERQRHLEGVPDADDEPQLGLEVEPVGGREAGPGVLEPPAVVLAQRGERRGGGSAMCATRGSSTARGGSSGGLSHAPPVASSSSSLQATMALFSQKPSGLSSAASMSSLGSVPIRCRPESCSARVIIDVPDRCIPVMAIGALSSPLPFRESVGSAGERPAASRPGIGIVAVVERLPRRAPAIRSIAWRADRSMRAAPAGTPCPRRAERWRAAGGARPGSPGSRRASRPTSAAARWRRRRGTGGRSPRRAARPARRPERTGPAVEVVVHQPAAGEREALVEAAQLAHRSPAGRTGCCSRPSARTAHDPTSPPAC